MSSPPIGRGSHVRSAAGVLARVEIATGHAVQRRLAAGFPAVPGCGS